MFSKELLVKDLDFNTIINVLKCYDCKNEEETVSSVLNKIVIEYAVKTNYIKNLNTDSVSIENTLVNRYRSLELELNTKMIEEKFNLEKSYLDKAKEDHKQFAELYANIYSLKQDIELLTKENKILEAKLDIKNDLLGEISNLQSVVSGLSAENSEKDSKFELLKQIYDNPRLQEVRVVDPIVLEPRIIPTVSPNKK